MPLPRCFFTVTTGVAAACLSGCGLFATKPDVEAANLQDLAPIVNALKAELRAYGRWAAVYPQRPTSGPTACQTGSDPQNDLIIRSAKVILNTKTDVTLAGGIDLPTIAPLTFTGPNGSKQVINEQTFTFDVGIVEPAAAPSRNPPSEKDQGTYLLATVIWKLRQQVLSINHSAPCVQFTDGEKPRLMPLTIGFTAAKTGSGGIKIVPGPLPVGLNASLSAKNSHSQTITLNMEVSGGPMAFTQ